MTRSEAVEDQADVEAAEALAADLLELLDRLNLAPLVWWELSDDLVRATTRVSSQLTAKGAHGVIAGRYPTGDFPSPRERPRPGYHGPGPS